MDEETHKICEAVCEGASCNWSKWNNPFDHQFPDGTVQTCVGAQVRCGCTLTMSLVSNVTYENPAAVVVTFLFISALVLLMLIRCCLTEQSTRVHTSIIQKQQQTTPETSDHIPDDNETGRDTNTCNTNNSHDTVNISNMEWEKPPPYTYVTKQDLNCLPPSYIECVQRKY